MRAALRPARKPKPSRLFLHPSLLPQHNSKRMRVVVLSPPSPGLLCPTKPTAPLPFPVPPPAETQKARSWLSPLSHVHLTTAGTFGLLLSARFFSLSLFFLSLSPFLSLTPRVVHHFQTSLRLFLSLNIKKKKKEVIMCVKSFPVRKSLAHLFLSPTAICNFS